MTEKEMETGWRKVAKRWEKGARPQDYFMACGVSMKPVYGWVCLQFGEYFIQYWDHTAYM
jgi:hypothetical protein